MANTAASDGASPLAIAEFGNIAVTLPDLLENLLNHQHWDVIQDCIDNKILAAVFQKYEIKPNLEELRGYANVFRQKNSLLTGDETHKWLELNHMTDNNFTAMCYFEVCLQRLKEILFENRLEQYFSYRQLELDSVEIYKIMVTSEEAAREISVSIKDGASFFDYARRYSSDESTRKLCGYAGIVPLHDLDPKEQELIAGSAEGSVVGPVKVARSFHIILVAKFYPAQFDGKTREKLLDELFTQWFDDFKAKSNISIAI